MNPAYILFFIAILVGTVWISYWSASRGTSTLQFYTAGGGLTGLQNGLAIAGDYVSAASFLGITGAIALRGFDGFTYSIGFMVSYLLLFLLAEPIHHLGKYTLGDVIYARFSSNKMRFLLSLNAITISILYMVPQLVAAGLLIELLLGMNYTLSVLVTGMLVITYVVFGGMVSTSWIQIVKTVLLMSGVLLVSLMVLSRFHWDLFRLLERVKELSPYKGKFFNPGNLFANPLDALSLNLTLILGTAGLPHILNRFFTVEDAPAVRKSILTATWVIGIFYLLTFLMGLGVVSLVGLQELVAIDPSGNLAAPLLGAAVGGEFFMAFISAVAFATVLAVATGLLLSAATSLSHDVYNHILKKGMASEKDQLQAARVGAALIGFISIVLSLGMKHMNAAFPVSLAFAVAASTNFPLLMLTLYWRRFTLAGAITGMITGLSSSLAMVELETHTSMFTHLSPGIFTIPLGFAGSVIGSLFSKPAADQESFTRVLIQSQTGIKTN